MKNHKMKQDRFKIQTSPTGRMEQPGSMGGPSGRKCESGQCD
jgi:hypothetical protein